MAEKVQKSEQEWREELSPEQYHVLREKGTERAFTGKYHDAKEPGMYRCAGCGAEVFRSDTETVKRDGDAIAESRKERLILFAALVKTEAQLLEEAAG